MITSGATQGLTLAMRAILSPGDVVACEDPSFMSVIRAIRAAGAKVQPVPVDEDGLDVDALEALLARTEIRALAIQPRLHNPTGRDLSPERRERLLELVRRHGFFIVEDGIYGELRMEGDERPSLRADAPAHAIYTDSLSKTVGGGLRAGWVIASGPVLDRIIAEKRSTTSTRRSSISSSPPSTWRPATIPSSSSARASTTGAAGPPCRNRSSATSEAWRTIWSRSAAGTSGSRLDSPVSERDLVDEAWRQGVAYAPGGR